MIQRKRRVMICIFIYRAQNMVSKENGFHKKIFTLLLLHQSIFVTSCMLFNQLFLMKRIHQILFIITAFPLNLEWPTLLNFFNYQLLINR